MCFFFSSRRRHTRYWRDWSSDVCSSDLKDKPSTDWLRIPLRTGFRNRHQLNVEGGDRFVGYKFSAVVAPASQGVMAGSKENLFALRSFVEYNHKNLHLQNDINFSQSQDRLSNYGAYADFGRIDGHVSPYAEIGSLLEKIGR